MSLWDESRLAVNALEMCENGNLIVTHFEGEPDMWNTKPPLLIWVQAFFMKLFGYNLLAFRLPSAIAGFITVLMVFFFCEKILLNERLGYFASLILITSAGYITDHVTRTGDYDAMLTMWTTLSIFLTYTLSLRIGKKSYNKLLYFIALGFGFAVLTKGIAGILFLPGVMIFLLLQKQIFSLLKNKHFYVAICLFIGMVFSYYFLRELKNPGYLEAVWNNELGGRYFLINENNSKEFSFYFRKMYESKFIPWLYFIPFSLFLTIRENENIRNVIKLLSIIVFTFLLIISISKTKPIWYDAPVYPLLAIIVGLGMEKIYLGLKDYLQLNQLRNSILTILFLIGIFGSVYQKQMRQSYWVSQLWTVPEQKRFKMFMDQIPQFKNYTIFIANYNAPIIFYKKVYGKNGYDIDVKQLNPFVPNGSATKKKLGKDLVFSNGEHVIICENSLKKELQEFYTYNVLKKWKSCELVVIQTETEK